MQVEGFIAPGFEPAAEAFAANFTAGEELGAGFAALRDGEILVEIWGGHADRAQTKPWASNTLAPVYSTSKGVAAIVAALCVERRLMAYEDLVTKLWPAFGAHGKEKLTIAETLSHQAGVPGFLDPIDPDLWLDPPACAAAIAALAPLWPPGSASGYHPLTWGYIIGAVVAAAAGRSLGSILREDLCAPLKIDFHIGLPDSEHARCAEMDKPRQIPDFGPLTPAKRAAFLQPWSSPKRGGALWRRIEIPSANGHGTALSVAQLYAIYATGRIGGEVVLSSETRQSLIARRISGPDLVLPFSLDWRSGLLGNAQMFYGPNRETLGHSGFGGSCGFGDPATGISVGYVMNKQSHHLMGDPRSLRVIDALYSCVR
jgi:CubicO group peptidase (beta-lactamase class C family)